MKHAYIIILLSLGLTACTSNKVTPDQTFPIGSGASSVQVDLTGLGKHEVIEYFGTQQGIQCYSTFGEYFKYKGQQEKSKAQTGPTELSTEQYAIDRAFSAIENIAINTSDNMRDVALAAHGFQPTGSMEDDMLAAMKGTCDTYGFYDWKRDQDTKQYAFWDAFSGKFLSVTKALGLGYLGADVAKHALDAATEKYDVGGNLTQVGGNQDNTQNNAGGTCAGEVVDGTCVTPLEEMIEEEPPIEEPPLE